MLQTDEPGDYVIATGETHSVREFVESTFDRLNLKGDDHVRIDEAYMRPSEVDLLLGDPSKAKRELNWQPTVSFDELVAMMVDEDLVLANREKTLRNHGHPLSNENPLAVH